MLTAIILNGAIKPYPWLVLVGLMIVAIGIAMLAIYGLLGFRRWRSGKTLNSLHYWMVAAAMVISVVGVYLIIGPGQGLHAIEFL